MRSRLRWLLPVISFIGGCAYSISGAIPSVQAAQTVVVRKGSSTESIAIADLRQLAETGTVPSSLRSFARNLSSQQRSQISSALRAKFEIDVLQMSRLLDTQIGRAIASSLASTTSRQDNVGVLDVRSGLVLGARAPEGLSLLSFIEAYPRQTLYIDLSQAFKVAENFNSAFWQTQWFMAEISPQLTVKRPQLTLPFDPTLPGTATVQLLNLKLNDTQRRREIPVDVYWSEAASPAKPIVVLSHGLGSVRTDMRYLAEHLASYGYVVAALEHPGSNESHVKQVVRGKAPLLDAQEFLDRPKDISFAIDELEKLNQAGELQGKLAPDRVMVIGYSLGGSTALSVAGAELQLASLKERCKGNVISFNLGEASQCFASGLPEDRYQLRDPRVKAAIAFNPTTSLIFGETGLSAVQIPTLIESASADKTTPALTEQIIGFSKIPAPKWLVGVVGSTHLSVKDPSTTQDQARQPNTLYTGGEIVGEQAIAIRSYMKAIALAMAAQLTDDAAKYAIFLTPEYAQLASTDAFPIRLVTEIPPEAQAVVDKFLENQAKR
ncbi:alpha/beta hydrolase [Coleofasciculus sp. FACHB-1120]|uniref:alpha/beta hydrolase n=1 Tax=Coleofasciculus sp. FACHB-1120 TaxID=2692783 RepID=UPI001689245B|nr:alpha/beta hydrolase [Coleofasciculus sp. FACHB-1120]MBD2742683.1 alpha/beta hydrolase [Coleofasciculus sp. FACHB-1120]